MNAIDRAAAYTPPRLDTIDDPYARMHIRLNTIEDVVGLMLDVLREGLEQGREIIEKATNDEQRRPA